MKPWETRQNPEKPGKTLRNPATSLETQRILDKTLQNPTKTCKPSETRRTLSNIAEIRRDQTCFVSEPNEYIHFFSEPKSVCNETRQALQAYHFLPQVNLTAATVL